MLENADQQDFATVLHHCPTQRALARTPEGGRTLMPLAVRMHHSCTAPFVLNALIADFQRRFPERA